MTDVEETRYDARVIITMTGGECHVAIDVGNIPDFDTNSAYWIDQIGKVVTKAGTEIVGSADTAPDAD